MRRFLSLTVGLLLMAAGGSALAATPPAGAAPGAQTTPSPCAITATKTATPDILLLGERSAVTIALHVACPDEPTLTHIVLVMDESTAMAGRNGRDAKASISNLVRDLRLDGNPHTRVGVAGFNDTTRMLVQLTNDTRQVLAGLNRLGAGGGSAVDLGILEGLQVLRRGRPPGGGLDIVEVMILVAAGPNDAGCEPVRRKANQVKGGGVLVIAVCVGDDCDEQCLRQVASAARYYFHVRDIDKLLDAFTEIRQGVVQMVLRRLTLMDTLAADMALDRATIQPAPTYVGPSELVITWQVEDLKSNHITFTYRVEPTAPGWRPVGLETTGTGRDVRNREAAFQVDQPAALVLRPFIVPLP